MVKFTDKYLQSSGLKWISFVVSATLLCFLLSVGKLHAEEQPTTDLRILVDVSGSMKNNDPQNLRRDALRLLIGMLPESSRVGIWSFGQYVNMQVKPDFATKAWKTNARKEANKIRSLGLFTNIEDTLTKSSWDWKRPDPKWDRHMILLTDGMVDISKDPKKNTSSRNKILGSILSDLAAANVKIHTIALSQQADHELLKKLSKKTEGWYESVDSADMLQRLFLRLFEKTTKMDSLPLEGNLFDVDDSISDMTLLVFRSRSGKETKVIMPDHSVLEYSKTPKNVEWFQDNNFDIITVRKPMSGKWKLDADIDKDNRVKIISNLKLEVAPLPIDIIENESVTLSASMLTKDGLLDDKDVLSLIKVSVKTSSDKGSEVSRDVPALDVAGKYETLLEGVGEKGRVQVVVKVTSPTFKRESRHEIKVHESPVTLGIKATNKGLVIDVTKNSSLLKSGTLKLALRIEGYNDAYQMAKVGDNHWQVILDNGLASKTITVNAVATRIDSTRFSSQLYGRLPEAVIPMKDPLTISAVEIESELIIKVTLEENLLQAGTLQLKYFREGESDQAIVILNKTENSWQQSLPSEYSGNTLIVNASGIQLNGEKFEKDYVVSIPELEVKEVVLPEPAKGEVDVEPVVEAEPENEAKDEDESPVKVEEEETSIVVIVIALIVANLIIFGGAYFGYRYWRKKNKPLSDDLEDEESKGAKASESDAQETSSETTDKDKKDKPEDAEDFSAQRKESTTPDNVDLDMEDTSEQKSDDKEAKDEGDPESDLIETASAEDLPEFDVDTESDMTEESKPEKDK